MSGGTMVIAATSGPAALFPPLSAGTAERQIDEQIYDYLLVVDPNLNYRDDGRFLPRLAESWTWSADSLSIAFRINPNARWHDSEPVSARDVQFTFQLYKNPELASPTALDLQNIDSVVVRDSLTAVVWYHARSAHQLLDASHPAIMPRHIFENIEIRSLREFAASAHPIGTGRFRFRNWRPDESIELDADMNNYRGRPKLDRVIWSISPNSAAAATKFVAGAADVFTALKPENIAEVSRKAELKVMSTPATEYSYLAFNLARPLFASLELRRALTMAVDRASIVKNIFDTLASPGIGPTVRVFPTTDTAALKQIPFDAERAKAILDSLGWRVGRDGEYRIRNDQELSFSTIVSTSSSTRRRMAVLLQEQLRRVGVRMKIDEMEYKTWQARQNSRDFDATLSNMILGATPEGIRELWGVESARQKDGSNYGAYSNSRFDAELDSALGARRFDESKKHFTRAYQIIIDDAPAIWISDQKWVIGLKRQVKPGVIRADSWWFDLSDWSISH
ncbi:MAG TPA: peptide ABC transporter substrate-binding protein [Gemmatimonadaceae bacterium]|jgi:peptide/nickel transport system substrate-binding protein|nr:peptide ABC transporter substrate-binding protein [Gemmatimonadaceae bacterium]